LRILDTVQNIAIMTDKSQFYWMYARHNVLIEQKTQRYSEVEEKEKKKEVERETYSDMASYSGSALFLDQLEIECGPVLILNEIYMIC